MPTIIRNLLVLLTASLVAWAAVPLARSVWLDSFVSGRTFNSSSEWLNTPALLDWLFHLLAFVPLGYFLCRYVSSPRRWVWAFALGGLYGCFLLAFTRHYFFSQTSFADYAIVYGAYFMPLVGALAGAFLHNAKAQKHTGA